MILRQAIFEVQSNSDFCWLTQSRTQKHIIPPSERQQLDHTMVITVTPVPPSAPLPGDEGQFQYQSGWACCACYSSCSLCEQMPVTSRQLPATILSATFYTFIYVLKKKNKTKNPNKNLNKQEKPNLGRSTRSSLCSVNHSFREAHQSRQKRVTFPKQRNQLKTTSWWKKHNSFTQ